MVIAWKVHGDEADGIVDEGGGDRVGLSSMDSTSPVQFTLMTPLPQEQVRVHIREKNRLK
jgi:hypothetical protein